MINHIDLSSVLRRTVCDLYTDLVTRKTGAAVRDGIEKQLADLGARTLTIIDFSNVGLLDYSCANEIVAKLLMRYGGVPADDLPPREAYFLFRGISDSHLDAIEAVLERHGLAIVAQPDAGSVMLVGRVAEPERRAWEAMCRLGHAVPVDLARETGIELDQVCDVLDTLCRRRLVMHFDEGYVAVGGTA